MGLGFGCVRFESSGVRVRVCCHVVAEVHKKHPSRHGNILKSRQASSGISCGVPTHVIEGPGDREKHVV